MTQVGVSNCFFIVDDGASEGAPGVGIDFTNVGQFVVAGNLLQFNGMNKGGGWGFVLDNAQGWGDRSVWGGTVTGLSSRHQINSCGPSASN